MGATVAVEMVTSGAFSGPVVLLGLSLSPRDESVILRVLDGLTTVMGSLPFRGVSANDGIGDEAGSGPRGAPRGATR